MKAKNFLKEKNIKIIVHSTSKNCKKRVRNTMKKVSKNTFVIVRKTLKKIKNLTRKNRNWVEKDGIKLCRKLGGY